MVCQHVKMLLVNPQVRIMLLPLPNVVLLWTWTNTFVCWGDGDREGSFTCTFHIVFFSSDGVVFMRVYMCMYIALIIQE